MPTTEYRLEDGTRVPGTTTIIGRFKPSGGLIHWAWKLGMDGKDYREVRDSAADVGTLAHEMMELHIKGFPITQVKTDGFTEEQVGLASEGYGAFVEWWDATKITVQETETHLVSEKHRFGGTPDAIGMQGDVLCLLDWKTSRRTYSDFLVQVAAYRELSRENGRDVRKCHLLRVGKEDGSFHHHYWPEQVLDRAWSVFRHMRWLYDELKVLEKSV